MLTEAAERYERGQQVLVRFVGANPNNNLHRGGSYLQVQRRDGDGWLTVADDNDWSTRFRWRNKGPSSIVTITWDVPGAVDLGVYRIAYAGDARDRGGTITAFTGTTREFKIQ